MTRSTQTIVPPAGAHTARAPQPHAVTPADERDVQLSVPTPTGIPGRDRPFNEVVFRP
jgi:hypothetical protein